MPRTTYSQPHPHAEEAAPLPSRRIGNRAVGHALSLLAAPTFVGMALLSALGPVDMICGAGSPLTGMTAMYALMGVFHLAPWLTLIGGVTASRASRRSAPSPRRCPAARNGPR